MNRKPKLFMNWALEAAEVRLDQWRAAAEGQGMFTIPGLNELGEEAADDNAGNIADGIEKGIQEIRELIDSEWQYQLRLCVEETDSEVTSHSLDAEIERPRHDTFVGLYRRKVGGREWEWITDFNRDGTQRPD